MIYICTHIIPPKITVEGEHIVIDNKLDELDENYGHLRGMHYVWKNLELPYEVGIFQYKRALDVISIPKGYDCVVAPHYSLSGIENISVYTQYMHCADMHPWVVVENILGDDFRQYTRNQLMKDAFLDNIFIMKRELFYEYCEFMFSVLAEKDKMIGSNDNRFLAERIGDYWIHTHIRKDKIFIAKLFEV